MSEDIRKQVIAHLNEQQAIADAREQARRASLEAAAKKSREDLTQFLQLCSSIIEPAIVEFRDYLEGQAITAKFSTDPDERPYPHILVAFSSKEPRVLGTVDFRHTSGESVEVRTKEGYNLYDSATLPWEKVTKESVQKALLALFKKLRI